MRFVHGGLTRRGCLGAALLGVAGVELGRAEDGVTSASLPLPVSLADALAAALLVAQPLVVLVSLEGCPFCRVARENYLAPLRRREGLPVVQLDMRSARVVRDFQQRETSHEALIRGWGIQVAPTVLFFGAQGREVAERLKGAYIADFYGAYLEQRLETARKRLL